MRQTDRRTDSSLTALVTPSAVKLLSVCTFAPHRVVEEVTEGAREEEVEVEEEQPSGRMSLCRLRDKKAGDDLNMEEERGAERQRDTRGGEGSGGEC